MGMTEGPGIEMGCRQWKPGPVGDSGTKHFEYEDHTNWTHTATSKAKHGSSSPCHQSHQEILASLALSKRTLLMTTANLYCKQPLSDPGQST